MYTVTVNTINLEDVHSTVIQMMAVRLESGQSLKCPDRLLHHARSNTLPVMWLTTHHLERTIRTCECGLKTLSALYSHSLVTHRASGSGSTLTASSSSTETLDDTHRLSGGSNHIGSRKEYHLETEGLLTTVLSVSQAGKWNSQIFNLEMMGNHSSVAVLDFMISAYMGLLAYKGPLKPFIKLPQFM